MKTKLCTQSLDQDVLLMLIDHFNYSVRDINSYNELTDEKKLFISEETFNKIKKEV